MAPLTRSRRCIQVPPCILHVLPDELWVPILFHLLMVQDVCKMKEVCSFFDAELLRQVLKCRIDKLYGLCFPLKKASTFVMAEKERLWSGLRLVAIDRRAVPDVQTRHADLAILREDPPLRVGRLKRDCNISDQTISRFHFMTLLNRDPREDYAMKLLVMGQNGIRFVETTNTPERIIYKDKSVLVKVGDEFEVAVDTGVFYRVEYL